MAYKIFHDKIVLRGLSIFKWIFFTYKC